jgi:hypothetical protein
VEPAVVETSLPELIGKARKFNLAKELNIVGPVTLHVEYPLLEKGEEKLTLIQQQEVIVRKLKKDTDFINSYLRKYQLI